jgi:hypothetical protein
MVLSKQQNPIIMKTLVRIFTAILLLSATLVTHQAKAQIVKNITIVAADDTLASADTAYVSLTFDGSFKSVEATIYEITGTIGGKIVFQGQLPHGDWAGLDSLALNDVDSTLQFKLFTVPNPRLHGAYRLKFLKSGTGSAPIKAYYVRYTGGAILRSDPNKGIAYLNIEGTRSRYIPDYFDQLYIGNLNKRIQAGILRRIAS